MTAKPNLQCESPYSHGLWYFYLSDLNVVGYMLDIFWFCFYSFDVYSIDSSKMIGNSPEVSDFNRLLFLELKPPVLPIQCCVPLSLAIYHSMYGCSRLQVRGVTT
jgi:hypothetical protein